ncbi:MAG TPA: hypothetical protein VFO41_15705 [Alphaproteobacteria bacterium]|nr:hypothetical protein [Alphaproteobacteria bacterium]
MPEISNSELKAAVSAIMQMDKSEPRPGETPQLAELSELRRAHHERLRSELAKTGLDFDRLEKLYGEYKEGAEKLFEKLTPPDESKPVEPTETDREWTENKKRVYELIAGRPLVTFPIVLDAPAAIYSVPSASLVDSHIGSWNSWARWKHSNSRSGSGFSFPDWEYANIRFLFAWQNNTPNVAVIKRARADLTVRGQLQAIAHPPLLIDVNTDVDLFAHHRVFVGSTSITSDHHYITGTVAHTDGWLKGGTGDFETVDLNRVKPVIFEDILVPAHQFAVFDVGLETRYKIQNGAVHYVFAGAGRYIACPSLVLELSLVVRS